MASIIDLFKKSEFSKIGKSDADKTPISQEQMKKT